MRYKPVWLALAFFSGMVFACQPTAPTRIAPVSATASAFVFITEDLPAATETPFLPSTLTPTPLPSDTPTPTASPSPSPSPTPTEPPLSRPLYEMQVTLDYNRRLARVHETITYPNRSAEALSALVLDVEPRRWEDAFLLEALQVNGQPISSYVFDGAYWEIPLEVPLLPGERLSVGITYQLKVPYKTASEFFGYDGYQLNLVDWYPRIVPYDEAEGWLWHKPWVVGEHQAYEASDFVIDLALENPPEKLVVAASAPPDEDAPTRYRLAAARTFIFSLSPEFLTSSLSLGDVEIISYYFPDLRFGGKALPGYAAQALQVFGERFGDYGRKRLSIVATNAADGMEYSGLVFLSRNFYDQYDGTVQNNLVSLGMHEVAHQWWFDKVGNDQALYPWLDEALATYSEHIFYETWYPDQVYWWWNFRVFWFSPEGAINQPLYQYDMFRPYVNAVYLRGALFIDALRRRIGDEAFFAFLMDYSRQMEGKLSSPDDFFRILAAHTEADYSDILQTYFVP